MNIIIIIPYYNNSHFIEIQINSFRKYLINCNWKLCVIDDSKDDTINVLTNKKENIIDACKNFENDIIYHKFPQHLHNNIDIAYVRHRNILTYITKHVCINFNDAYDYMLIFDADMCFIEYFDTITELSSYDIIAPKRIQWLSNKQISDSPIFEYMWVHCCFFNLKTIMNISEMNFNAIPNTTADTGSMLIEFLHNNPHYKIRYLPFSSGNEFIEKLHYFEFFNNNTIIHFGSGSLWNIDTLKYKNESYKDKFEFFKKIVIDGLSDDEKNIIKLEYEKTWFLKHKLFIGKKYSKEDLKKYNMNIK